MTSEAGRSLLPFVAVASGVVLTAVCPGVSGAQSWQAGHQQVQWLSGSVDRPVTEKTALWLDGSWRRVDMGRDPQQLVLRPGVQYQLAPNIRLASGYAYLASQPTGALAASAPSREHRMWQQVVLTQKAGPLTLTHRYRLEQRWTHAVLADPGAASRRSGPVTYQNRGRYMVRVQSPLGKLSYRGRPVTVHGWSEALAALGGAHQFATVLQDRIGAGVTLPITAQLRVESSYLRLHNILTSRKANEVNHTMVMAWSWTGTARR